MVVAVVDAEPGALGQDRLKAEGAAEMRVQIVRKIIRRIMEFGDDAVVDVGDQAMPDFVWAASFQSRRDCVPNAQELAT